MFYDFSHLIFIKDLYNILQLLRLEFDPNYKFHFHFDNTELILHFELEIEQNEEWHKVGQAELNLVQGLYDPGSAPVCEHLDALGNVSVWEVEIILEHFSCLLP